MKLSIVASIYRSAEYVEPFCDRIIAATQQIPDEFEIVLVNDGSPDDALQRAIARVEQDARVSVVDLSRNFGHHKAMMTELAHTDGDLAYLIDIDLEELPEWLIPFHRQLKEQGCDVVCSKQETRRGGCWERWSGEWFYILVNYLARLDLPRNIVTARLTVATCVIMYLLGAMLCSKPASLCRSWVRPCELNAEEKSIEWHHHP